MLSWRARSHRFAWRFPFPHVFQRAIKWKRVNFIFPIAGFGLCVRLWVFIACKKNRFVVDYALDEEQDRYPQRSSRSHRALEYVLVFEEQWSSNTQTLLYMLLRVG
jgi:hypothetical protein